ncbi:MAG: glycosyl transferase [Clostridiales bacterium]|nr:glycosyl transferase [Clostridiales bacterium]
MARMARLTRRLNGVFPVAMTRITYRRRLGRPLDLRRPQTYNDKINWLKLYDYPRNPDVIRCADKYLVRAFAAERGLSAHLNPLIGAWDDPRGIDFDSLPTQFVLKANHGCHMNIVCRDKARLDRAWAVGQLTAWLARDFGRETAQLHYSAIARKVICEALIEGERPGQLPADYKIHCFHGQPAIVNHTTNRAQGILLTHYDLQWNRLPISSRPADEPAPRPALLDQMIAVSRAPSKGFRYVRVDLYAPRDRVILGEMTFTPAAGFNRYATPEGDRWMGELLDISDLVARRRRR